MYISVVCKFGPIKILSEIKFHFYDYYFHSLSLETDWRTRTT